MGLLRRKRKPVPVIDLREAAAPPGPQWGSPVTCPACGGRGYLDHIDPFREVMYQHCLECGATYDVTSAELEPGIQANTA